MGLRRSGREAAVSILYSLEFSDMAEKEAIENYWSSRKGSNSLKKYTETLVEGVVEHRPEVDSVIGRCSKNWEVERLPDVDRNIVRLAVFELMECKDVPSAVIINEALEIAKEYSSEKSALFVNGILGEAESKIRPKN